MSIRIGGTPICKPYPRSQNQPQPTRGEVWLFDLGMAAKTCPVLVVSVAYGDADRAIFLQPGAFLVQGISTHPKAWAILSREAKMAPVMAGLRGWLGLTQD